MVDLVIGTQWGDEGKGKLIDLLAGNYDIIARANGGANAGHSVKFKDKSFAFHLIPSGVFSEKAQVVIGHGTVLHLETLEQELNDLEKEGISVTGRLFISDRAHITTDLHKEIDGAQEELKAGQKVGTTKRGIGPTYADKMNRIGLRMYDLLEPELFEEKLRLLFNWHKKTLNIELNADEYLAKYQKLAEKLKPFIADTAYFLNKSLKEGKTVLVEGAHGVMLDIDHGTYPFVTSSNVISANMATGLGLPPQAIKDAFGIVKAYTTRVGSGPFPTELTDALGDQIREAGGEYGTTTGRPRRCGWFDAMVVKYAVMLCGLTAINLTKLDVLDKLETVKFAVGYSHNGKKLDCIPASLKVLEEVEVEYLEMPGWQQSTAACRKFADLPQAAQDYVKKLEELVECPIRWIGVGPKREETVVR
ncbi:MAG: adenylosuccinate synthase [Candidatus Gracilibacteria bacterium]|nr:adenylosuccinate synthase [Candidatus Gracilibacteria bacterium]